MSRPAGRGAGPAEGPAEVARELAHWEDRFRASRWDLVGYSRARPDRVVLLGNASGVTEVFTWDTAGEPVAATRRPEGTSHAAVDPAGRNVWWFADEAGNEFGSWRRQPVSSLPGSDVAAAPGVPDAYAQGLALGESGLAVLGCGGPGGTVVYACPPDGPPRVLYTHAETAWVTGLSPDEERVLIAHSEHGDSRHLAARVLTLSGEVVADLWDGPGRGLDPVEFSPDGRSALLVHERNGRSEPLLWDPVTGLTTELSLELAGELSASFFPDGASLLVLADYRARTTAWRYELTGGGLERIGPAAGRVSVARGRPDGTAWLDWSSSEAAPALLVAPGGTTLLAPPPPPAPASVPVTDVCADGPGGKVHALLTSSGARGGPLPAVFLVHGGPDWQDTDSFSPTAAAWVDAGYAVVRVNYRGSTGYGSAWRDALEAAPGLIELEDVAAVADRLIADGVVDPDRCVLTGASWGGFLTLLGLGWQPERWACGIAVVPVADYVTAYDDEMEPLQAFDRSLFGGTPEQVPDRYHRSSPLTYVDRVRVPVLVVAGENDPRCPLRQIENYLAALSARGAEHEVYRFDAGHGSLVTEERIRQTRVMLDFADRRGRTAGR